MGTAVRQDRCSGEPQYTLSGLTVRQAWPEGQGGAREPPGRTGGGSWDQLPGRQSKEVVVPAGATLISRLWGRPQAGCPEPPPTPTIPWLGSYRSSLLGAGGSIPTTGETGGSAGG